MAISELFGNPNRKASGSNTAKDYHPNQWGDGAMGVGEGGLAVILCLVQSIALNIQHLTFTVYLQNNVTDLFVFASVCCECQGWLLCFCFCKTQLKLALQINAFFCPQIDTLQRSLSDSRENSNRLSSTIESLMTSHSELQEAMERLQTDMGQKESELNILRRDK